MVTTRRAAARRATGIAFSKLSGDEQGIILGQLRNTLEPRLVMYFSSASKQLRALLPLAVQQQLRADYEEATALCLKMGMRGCKKMRQARRIEWDKKGLSASDLATLAKLGSVLPALEDLTLGVYTSFDGVQRLAEGLIAGALPAVTYLGISGMHVGGAAALALSAALDRGALPRLRSLKLSENGWIHAPERALLLTLTKLRVLKFQLDIVPATPAIDAVAEANQRIGLTPSLGESLHMQLDQLLAAIDC